MRAAGCVLLIVGVLGTQLALARTTPSLARSAFQPEASAAPTVDGAVPTVALPGGAAPLVPTVTVPRPTPVPRKHKPRRPPVRGQWIWAYLTSYCPGTAGWVSSSGAPVFYGMLANDYYRFGTRVYIPALGMTGVVEDRFGYYNPSNYFDVWSPVCYGTPTGWFKVAILR